MGLLNGLKKQMKEAYEEGKNKGKKLGSFEYQSEKIEEKKQKKLQEKDRISNMKKEGVVFCPKCKSTSITYVEKHKKLSIGRAVVGGALAGETGAILGGLTSKKVKGKVKCLNCGYEWKPGKR